MLLRPGDGARGLEISRSDGDGCRGVFAHRGGPAIFLEGRGGRGDQDGCGAREVDLWCGHEGGFAEFAGGACVEAGEDVVVFEDDGLGPEGMFGSESLGDAGGRDDLEPVGE